MTKTAFAWTAAAIMSAALAFPVFAQLPNGDGREVVRMVCAGCHDLSPITGSDGFSKEDWEIVVKSMINMGARIKPEDIPLITTYLAQAFPPKPKN